MDRGKTCTPYDRTHHAAAWTADYLFHQLIPYIGNKRKLLGPIGEAVERTGVRAGSFVDLFAGSGVVSRLAKRLGFAVTANDWEPYAQAINTAYVACNAAPAFAALGGYAAAIDRLNALPPREDWIARHLCPADDERFDTGTERMFYTRANGLRLDAIRHQIALWEAAGLLDERERACLLAPLLYQASYVSNTSGVFKGFHKGWGGQTGTALYRIKAAATLQPVVFFDNGQANACWRMDAQHAALRLRDEGALPEIVYLDPPYNQHPYGSNYHVLNSVALWDKPPLSRTFQDGDKSAIRTDWRTLRRSPFNHRREAAGAFERLLAAIDARWILTSYSTDGQIPLEQLVRRCVERGRTTAIARQYKRYRVSSQRFSRKPLNVEFVLITDGTRPHRGASVEAICGQLHGLERRALAEHREAPPPNP